MITAENLKELIHQKGMNRRDILMLCLAVSVDSPKAVKGIVELATNAGLPECKSWNVSRDISSARGLVRRMPNGWELTSEGRAHVAELAGIKMSGGATRVIIQSLRSEAESIPSDDTKEFVLQSVECYEGHHYRAAVVLSWVGAVSLLHDHVVAVHMSAFNTEATRRNAKWKYAKNADDLGRMTEFEFLEVLEAISVIGKNVKAELQKCLKLRNGCGHPNSLKIGEHIVAAHIEMLILNVFVPFSLK